MERIPTEIKFLNLTGIPVRVSVQASKIPGRSTYNEKREQIDHLNIRNNEVRRTQMYLYPMMGAYNVSVSSTCSKVYKAKHLLNNLGASIDTKQIIFLLDPKGVEPIPFPLQSGNHRIDELEGDVVFLRDEGLYTPDRESNCDKKYYPSKGISSMRQALLAYLEAHNMDTQMETIVMPLHTSDMIQSGFIGDAKDFNRPYYHHPDDTQTRDPASGSVINVKSDHSQRHFAAGGEDFPLESDYLNNYDFSESKRVKRMKEGYMMMDHKRIEGFEGDSNLDQHPWYTRYWYYARNRTQQWSTWCWGMVIIGVILLVALAIGFIFIVMKKSNGSMS